MLPLYRSRTKISFEQASELPRCRIEHDWSGAKALAVLEFLLVLDPQQLLLLAWSNAASLVNTMETEHSFIEGLWEKDVVELFVSDASSTSYQEFNLAPNGSWWSATFSEYRSRSSEDFSRTSVQTISSLEQNQRLLGIMIPLSAVFPSREFCAENLRGNVCAIIGNAPRQYLSFAPGQSEHPDFHLSELRRQALLIPTYLQ